MKRKVFCEMTGIKVHPLGIPMMDDLEFTEHCIKRDSEFVEKLEDEI